MSDTFRAPANSWAYMSVTCPSGKVPISDSWDSIGSGTIFEHGHFVDPTGVKWYADFYNQDLLLSHDIQLKVLCVNAN